VLPVFFSGEKGKDSDDGATDGPTPKVAATSFSASFDIWPEGVMPVHARRRQSAGRQGSGSYHGANLCERLSYEYFYNNLHSTLIRPLTTNRMT
jgi:hypothetical protein